MLFPCSTILSIRDYKNTESCLSVHAEYTPTTRIVLQFLEYQTDKKNSLTVSEGEWYLAKKQPYSLVVLPSLKALRNADSSIQDRSRKYSEQ